METHRDLGEFPPDAAAAALVGGAVVVVPTDTVYGIAASPLRPEAVARLFAAKGRPSHLELPVIIGEIDQLEPLGLDMGPVALALAETFWPGPLTLVLGFAVTGRRPPWLEGRDEVAVRIPDHDYLRAVAQAAGPLLVTSANGHGIPPAVDVDDAVASLVQPPDVVIDGGRLSSVASTLVNTRTEPPTVERVGAIDVETLVALASVDVQVRG